MLFDRNRRLNRTGVDSLSAKFSTFISWMVGSGDGAGYLPPPGRPTTSTLAYGKAGAAVLATGVGRVGYVLYFSILSIISSFSNASSVGRRLDILKYCGLSRYNPAVLVSYYRRSAR